MTAKIDEIADGIFHLSIFVPEIAPPAGFTFNHFLIRGEEPLLFHCGKRIRYLDTPHVPHGWDAGVIFEETTRTLFVGDLFSHYGNPAPVTRSEIVTTAMAGNDETCSTSLGPTTAPTIRKIAELKPDMLAVMHGSSFAGDRTQQLNGLADAYDVRLREAMSRQ